MTEACSVNSDRFSLLKAINHVLSNHYFGMIFVCAHIDAERNNGGENYEIKETVKKRLFKTV
jgi:hypothetical protein